MTDEYESIFLAVIQNDIAMAARVLGNDPSVIADVIDDSGDTPLHVAVERGNFTMVEFLLGQPGIDAKAKNTLGFDPLDMAIRLRHQPMITDLLFRHKASQLGLDGRFSPKPS